MPFHVTLIIEIASEQYDSFLKTTFCVTIYLL